MTYHLSFNIPHSTFTTFALAILRYSLIITIGDSFVIKHATFVPSYHSEDT